MDKGTPLGEVRGIGAAHEGAGHWLEQRYTAAGNLFLMTYFVVSALLLPDLGYATLADWLSGLVPSTLLVLLIVSLFWHARLGLQVMIEDYVGEPNRFGLTVLFNLLAIGGGALAIMSVLRLALGSAA